MEHRNSTVMTSQRSIAEGRDALLDTVAHEFFHSWNVERIRPASLEPFALTDVNMSGELWLAEGFTNYYGSLATVRSGVASFEDFVANLEDTINAVVRSPGRRVRSAVEVSRMAPFVDAAVWNDRTNFGNTYLSYYTWGEAIASGLDLTLRSRSGGRVTLDDFMHREREVVETERGLIDDNLARHDITVVQGAARFIDAHTVEVTRFRDEPRRITADVMLIATGSRPLRPAAIPLDDAKTFELLSSGETTGVFQLESAGMRRYIRELRPSSVYDLAAMVALFRPGPMDNIPAYIRRKHGQEAVTFLHPLLTPCLEKTYGIFVYQEDIMAAAVALGGFTGPEADTLGYAIRKKKANVLRAQKEKFITQAAERGIPSETIDAVFKAFEPFERYGFNKAHATCYGLIAYQTAYLKANYTVEYMCSVLTAFRDNTDKVAAAIAECRRLGITVRPPSILRSGLHFTVEEEIGRAHV